MQPVGCFASSAWIDLFIWMSLTQLDTLTRLSANHMASLATEQAFSCSKHNGATISKTCTVVKAHGTVH